MKTFSNLRFDIAPLYYTNLGAAYCIDSLYALKSIADKSISLAITSPPFALQRKKEYGNKEQEYYVDWLLQFTSEIKRILKDDGSFVIDLGGAYQKSKPIRSLYNYRVLLKLCDDQEWNLAEEFFWYNPSKLPSPIEWVNKRKIRAKDAVNTVWWLSKSDFPKADISRVLIPYSKRMKTLLEDSEKYYSPKERPSGHNISSNFSKDNGGAIPSNLLQIPNTESNSQYLRYCKLAGIKGHPARFPERLPEFFIEFLTEKNDIVLDFFAGSNTTGAVAERLGRQWIALDIELKYLAASSFRFLSSEHENVVQDFYNQLLDTSGNNSLSIPVASQLHLFENKKDYKTD
jgi:site-specific DNA-methyltransferase (cytosine-N4-specific)